MENKAINLILKKLEGDKLTGFDIGAKGGVFLIPKLKNFFDFYGFEPNVEEFNRLKNSKNTTYFPFAIGEYSRNKKFYITKHASYSSFLKLDHINFKKHFGLMKDYPKWRDDMQIKKTVSVEVSTIDNLLSEQNIDQIDFLKLDTQGTELEILKGAHNSLVNHKIGVIFSEFSFIKCYANQNSFSELEIYLKKYNYECIDCRFYPNATKNINPLFRNKIYENSRYSVGGDAIFIPKIENTNLSRNSIFKIALIIANLGYYSVANTFFNSCKLSEIEINELLKYSNKFNTKELAMDMLPPFIIRMVKSLTK